MKAPALTYRVPSLAACFLLAACSEPKLNTSERREAEPEAFERENTPLQSEDYNQKLALAMTRAEIIGNKFNSLTLASRIFNGVTITNIDDSGICFSHSKGTTEISWGQVSPKVKDQWGFDSEAFDKIRTLETLSESEREAYLNSPEYKQSQREVARIKEDVALKNREREKTTIENRIATLEKESSEKLSALTTLESRLKDQESSFEREDSNAARIRESGSECSCDDRTIGGVTTSRADRKRSQEKWISQVELVRRKVEKLELAIEAEERKLKKLLTAEDITSTR